MPQPARRRARSRLRKAAQGRRTRNKGAAAAEVSLLFDPAKRSAPGGATPLKHNLWNLPYRREDSARRLQVALRAQGDLRRWPDPAWEPRSLGSDRTGVIVDFSGLSSRVPAFLRSRLRVSMYAMRVDFRVAGRASVRSWRHESERIGVITALSGFKPAMGQRQNTEGQSGSNKKRPFRT